MKHLARASWAITLLLGLWPLSGCDSRDDTSAAAVEDNRPITLVVTPWPTAAVTTAIARQLLTDELGVEVDLLELDEQVQWQALLNDEADATLEVWPSAHPQRQLAQITTAEEGDPLVDGGALGVVARVGWYVPTYALPFHPELASWEGVRTPAAAFELTNADQVALLALMNDADNPLTAEQAAALWVAQNQSVWKKWLK